VSFSSPQVSISQWFKEQLEAIPEGPGRGKSAIGQPVTSATYRFQWRVGYRGEGYAPLISVAAAIQERLMDARQETLADGKTASFMVDVTDLPPQPVDDSGRPMQELGGEVFIFVDFGVS
jgi:hypothetical protein